MRRIRARRQKHLGAAALPRIEDRHVDRALEVLSEQLKVVAGREAHGSVKPYSRKMSAPRSIKTSVSATTETAAPAAQEPTEVREQAAHQPGRRFELVEYPESEHGRALTQRPVASLVSGSTSSQRAWAATLLDNLLALSAGNGVRSLVVAAAADDAANEAVVGPLAVEVENRGLSVLTASLESHIGRSVLCANPAASRRKPASDSRMPAEELSLVLPGGAVPEDFDAWLNAAHETHDLVIIAGPALDRSTESALLARACDGLVLIAEAEATSRDDLRLAADRSRATGCHIFGVVVKQTRAISHGRGGSRR